MIDHFQRCKSTDVVYLSSDQFFLTHASALSYGNGEVKTIRRSDLAQPATARPANTIIIVYFDILNPVNAPYYGHAFSLFEDKYPEAEDPYENRIQTFEEVIEK